MLDTYITIQAPCKGIYKEKGSKFLACAIPVSSLNEIKTTIECYKKEYYDARHICFAYMLGAEKKEFRSNDDGEPSGTAGKPILGRILSHDLTNILIIVVRYFGGTKLGTSGLIHAYKTATEDAINQATFIQKIIQQEFTIQFDYTDMNDVMRIIKDENAEIDGQSYENSCEIKGSIRYSEYEKFSQKIKKIKSASIQL